MKRVPDQFDMLRPQEAPREPFASIPYQSESIASKQAAEKVSPVFKGNREACLNAVRHQRTTRKMIADTYFDGKQNYVTGPVAVLISEGWVYEEPLRVNGVIQRNTKGEIIPVRIDGSAVLLPTERAKAIA